MPSEGPSLRVDARDAKSKLPELLESVSRGHHVVITRHGRNIARLIPAEGTSVDRSVFTRMRALRARLLLGKGETARDLIDAGRREKFCALASSCTDLPDVPPHATPDMPRDE